MTAAWTAVTVTVPAPAAEAVGAFLLDQGSPGLVTEDVGGVVRLTAHFSEPPALETIRDYCARLGEVVAGAGTARVEVESVAEQDWAENWKQHFAPLAIGERLFVHPPWQRQVPAGRVGVEIDPGMAFGTGHHATTCGCLIGIDRFRPTRSEWTLLDVGTGSGILAIAALRLGAARAVGVDVDPEACRVATGNAGVNGVGDRVRVLASLDEVGERFDLVVANLFAGQLIELAPRLAEVARPGGVVIGSGIQSAEARVVESAWEGAGLAAVSRYSDGDWVTLTHEVGSGP